MYAIYGNIYHQYTPHGSIYTIHGSYGYVFVLFGCFLSSSKSSLARVQAPQFMGPPSVQMTPRQPEENVTLGKTVNGGVNYSNSIPGW